MSADPLPVQQGLRLSVLHAVWDALHIGEIDSWDLIRCAHWVHTGQEIAIEPLDRDRG